MTDTSLPTPSRRGSALQAAPYIGLAALGISGFLVFYMLRGVHQPADDRPLNSWKPCDSAEVRQAVIDSMEQSVARRTQGLSIIALRDITEWSQSGTQMICNATAELNDTSLRKLQYSLTMENGIIFTRLDFDQ